MATLSCRRSGAVARVWDTGRRARDPRQISQDGALCFKDAPDYENPVDSRFDNTCEVTLRATYDGSPSQDDIHRVRVTVTASPRMPSPSSLWTTIGESA